MQPIKTLMDWLRQNADSEHYLFTLQDLRALFPDLSSLAFKTLMSRSTTKGLLERICRGIYAYKSASYSDGLLLFHVAAKLRSSQFNYISLETVLSDVGVISQIPINVISLMSSGRSSRVSCGKYGKIEFIHTEQRPEDIIEHLSYDTNCGLWRANVQLALKDMKRTGRNADLIDWEMANEFI